MDCLQQSSLGAPELQLRGVGAGSWVSAGSTARTEVYTPTVKAQVSESFPRPLGKWCCIPQLPQWHFSWMDAKLLLLRGRYN